ncbi:MAG: hypothetical protein HKO59_03265 [Phycisphaerales bacterium]|nr:hypothetical protein [Phycisphaerae bacterium]NNM25001.1 hypothetical protein [Phycisphaerales bacterium]
MASVDHDAHDHEIEPSPGRGIGWLRGFLLVASIAMMACGLGLPLLSAGDEPTPATAETPAAPGDETTGSPDVALPFGDPAVGGDADGGGDADARAEPAASVSIPPDWAPVIFRLGFSFFVGFAIAFAARRFLRLAIMVAGFALMLLFGLQYAQIIDVNWAIMETHYDSLTGWLGHQTSSFTRFISGYLPSSAMAVVGLATGFKKG